MNNNSHPTLSIIVPIYNVESYLKDCFASVEQQTFTDYEVILVDDGSTDASPKIASEYASARPHYHYYRKENAGSGSARNFGVEKARGTYIAFLDPDDVIERHMYERLITALERDGSDFVVCHARRFNSTSYSASWIHTLALADLPHRTSIRECPQLIYDTTVWNKVIKRDFYVGTGITFPEKIRYQDIPVSIPLHVLADHISVVHDVEYYWRERDGVSKSATQQTETLRNLQDRIISMGMLDRFLAQTQGCERVIDAWRKKSLQHDLNLFVNQVPYLASDEERDQFRELICAYITQNIDAHYLDEVSIICQEKTQALLDRDYQRLAALRDFQNNEYYHVPVMRMDGALHAQLPESLFLSGRCDITLELSANNYRDFIDDVRIGDTKIEIYGHLYARRQEMLPGEQTVKAYLSNELTAERCEVPVEQWSCTDLTRARRTIHSNFYDCDANYNYDGAGFKIVVDLTSDVAQCLPSGELVLLIEYQNPFRRGSLPLLFTSYKVRQGVANMSALHERCMVTVTFDDYGALHLLANNHCETLRDYAFDDGRFICALSQDVAQLVAESRENPVLSYEFERTGQGSYALDVRALPDNMVFSLCAIDEQGVQRRVPLPRRDIAVLDTGQFVLVINSLREYYVKIEKKPSLACITKVTHKGSHLSFEVGRCGQVAQCAATEVLWQLEDKLKHGWKTVGEQKVGEGDTDAAHFSLDLGSPSVIADLYSGFRKMRIAYRLADGSTTYCELLSKPYYRHQFKSEYVWVTVFRNAEGHLDMQVSTVWPQDINSVSKRNQLRDNVLKKYRQLPLENNLVLFESWAGAAYEGNPRALYEYLNAHYPHFTCVWALDDERTPVPGSAVRVRKHTRDYLRYLSTAAYVVIDDQLDPWFQKREGQMVVQTTHGTPLKKEGLDVARAEDVEEEKQRFIAANQVWDYLTVQGQAFEDRVQSIYGTETKTLATGHPRTDRLLKVTAREKAQIRQTLGIDDSKTVVLYAPTWRSKNTFNLHLDLEALRESLGENYVLLIRKHRYEAGTSALPADDSFVYDMTHYQAIEDLMIASDVLVSDYSSTILDYALLDKPILLYAYDYDEYASELRGLYVDYRERYPQLLCTTQQELTEKLMSLDAKRDAILQDVKTMRETQLDYERATSAAAIIKRVMKPSKLKHMLKTVLRKVHR